MSDKLSPYEVLLLRGLSIPASRLRRLRGCGIQCEPGITKKLANLCGIESGGALPAIGFYCGYVASDGSPLDWSQYLESSVSKNQKHASVVGTALIRVQVFRDQKNYELLITKHEMGFDNTPFHSLVLRAHGHLDLELWGRDSKQNGFACPSFRDTNHQPVEIPGSFQLAVLEAVAGSNCVGCRHTHLLIKPVRGRA